MLFQNRVLRTCATNVVDSSVVSLTDNIKVLGRAKLHSSRWRRDDGETVRMPVTWSQACAQCTEGKAAASIGCHRWCWACSVREFGQIVGVRRGRGEAGG
jgi:hypothetical protein